MDRKNLETKAADILKQDKETFNFLDEDFHDQVSPEQGDEIGISVAWDLYLKGVLAGLKLALKQKCLNWTLDKEGRLKRTGGK